MNKGSNWDDSTQFEPETYEDQLYVQRVEQGLTIDRSRNNSRAYLDMNLFEMAKGKIPSDPLFFLTSLYRTRRKNDWNTKRWANARMVDLINPGKQMVELFRPILLDMLSADPSTLKNWKNSSGKDEKQVRRTKEYYPHVVNKPNRLRLELWEKDGSISTYPKRIVRDDVRDARVAEIATEYSRPPISSASFDPRVFADEAYIVREAQFWKNALHVLSKWLEDGGRIRPQKAWLPYHIVNNDIGLHVLFDNLSEECESHWLKTLDEKDQAKFCNGSMEISDDKGDKYLVGGTVPNPYSLDNAKKAVSEHESFLDNFEKEVPENLRWFMIPQDKMRERIRDLILEAAVELKPYRIELVRIANVRQLFSQTAFFADDWDLVCMALASSNLHSGELGS